MSQLHIPLESIRVAAPCKASWENMEGNGHARFCLTCHKNVYNLSEMSRSDAEALIQEKEGKLCVRFYQRADGTIMTGDCPVGLRIVQRPFKWLAAGAALLLASGIALATGNDVVKSCAPTGAPPSAFDWRNIKPVRMVMDMITPKPAPVFMGEMAYPVRPVAGNASGGNSSSVRNGSPNVRHSEKDS